jgi:hypothetical protein
MGEQFEVGGIELDGVAKDDSEAALTGRVEEGRADLIWIGRQGPIELLDRCSILRVQKYRNETERIGGARLVRLRNTDGTVANNEIGDGNI